jgi:hypothetical protein
LRNFVENAEAIEPKRHYVEDRNKYTLARIIRNPVGQKRKVISAQRENGVSQFGGRWLKRKACGFFRGRNLQNPLTESMACVFRLAFLQDLPSKHQGNESDSNEDLSFAAFGHSRHDEGFA